MESPTKLTEFAPPFSEVNKETANSFAFTKFFRRGAAKIVGSTSSQAGVNSQQGRRDEEQNEQCVEQNLLSESSRSDQSQVDLQSLDRDLAYNRSLTNVLRRISNILDRRITCAQAYKDSDFKQYWMPDSNCKECYDCGDKFTTFRRRHHCRVCGQIFCSRCCNQEIPGKIIGCTGDLRVCKYCCKVVLSYLQSTDSSCDSSDLRVLQEDLQAKLSLLDSQADSSTYEYSSNRAAVRRKNSTSFREEGYVQSRILAITDASLFPYGRDFVDMDQSGSLKRQLVHEPRQLHELWMQIKDPVTGIAFQSHRHRLRTYANCLVGSSIVDWLFSQGKVTSRTQGIAICQALIDATYLEPVTSQEPVFLDEYVLYKAGEASRIEDSGMHDFRVEIQESQEGHEPSWVKEIKQAESYTPSISTDEFDDEICNRGELGSRLPSSNSLFYLTLDHEENRVSVTKTAHGGHSQKTGREVTLESSAGVSGSSSAHNLDSVGRSTINDDLLKGALQADHSHGQEESAAFAGWHSEQSDRQDGNDRSAFDRLSIAYNLHESTLLNQLLRSLNLSVSWSSVILPIIHKVVETVHLDVKHNSDDIDIRQYVQFKKIPSGNKSDCGIVNGVVCSKNIAHKKMKSQIVNPCIMLVSSPIVYQRQENKFLSLEPAVLQEHDYLKNVVAKVASFKPDLILVEKTVSRVAQEFLLDLELTLVLNVKSSVMERVARCTQGEIVSSIDAQITKPRLGMCHNFRIKNYTINGVVKTLMFFEGCASHLGCTVKLRGAGKNELGKVKQVMQFMLFVAYNWRLECSFLMDEFAMPPTLPDDYALLVESFKQERIKEDFKRRNSALSLNSPTRTSLPVTRNTSSSSINSIVSQVSLSGDVEVPVRCHSPHPEEAKTCSGWKVKETRTKGTSVEDSSDPLSLYLRGVDSDIDEAFVPAVATPELLTTSLPTPTSFRKLLGDIVLCSSPFVKFSVPYLVSDSGRKCKLRQFFSKQVYWSKHLWGEPVQNNVTDNSVLGYDEGQFRGKFWSCTDEAKILASHPFLDLKLTLPVDDPKVQAVLADFRARGGRLRKPFPKTSPEDWNQIDEKDPEPSTNDRRVSVTDDSYWDGKVDALDPFNHQRLAVLFCSYSYTSNNAPNFCVHPWVVQMDFYGRNDITLGGFLERYCFRTTYMCPSSNCDSPMTEHVRRFVHESGCVHILLRKMENPIQKCANSIVTWTWCRKCKQVSPVTPLSMDTWSYSFAKYLELRFHGNSFTRRGSVNCAHSLHQDHYQYFAFGNIVAAFKYSGILLREIEFPPATIECNEGIPPTSCAIIEDIKNLAVTGHGVYSSILERLCTMKVESAGTKYEQVVAELMAQHQAERTVFREKIEEIQVKLTSPTVETLKLANQKEAKLAFKAVQTHMWKISDCVVNLKRLTAESVTGWNNRVAELLQQKKKEEKSKPSLANLKIISAQAGSHAPTTADCLTCPSPMWEANTTELTSQTQWWKDLPTDVEKPTVKSWNQSVEKITDRSSSDQSTDQSTDNNPPDDPEIPLEQSSSANDASDCSSASSAYMIGILPGLKAGIKTSSGSEDLYDESYVICQTPPVPTKEETGKPEDCQETNPSITTDAKPKQIPKADEEVQDVKSDKKSSVKNIFSQLLSHSATSPLQLPFPMSEHHLLPRCEKVPIVVYDDEPSSIIAYTLSSGDYEQGMLELSTEIRESQNSSPVLRRKAGNPKESEAIPSHSDISSTLPDSSQNTAARKSGVLAFFRSADRNSPWVQKAALPVTDSPFDAVHYSPAIPEKDVFDRDEQSGAQEDPCVDGDKAKSGKTSTLHLETQFSDSVAKYYCRVYFADQFRQLRKLVVPEGEESYIRSLSRCVNWQAKGGKSGCLFCKTHDDRFILKQMTRLEVQSFLEFGSQYINYITKAFLEQKPTVLTKIIGVYRIGYRNAHTTAASKMDLLVMENLFYQKNVNQKFDLKGSVRNRMVNVSGKVEADTVLLDENLLKMTCDRPLYIRPHSKTVLALAINNDTQFLSSQLVMDYSLLVGVDDEAKQLVVGIIDYMRTFTWDKKLETLVKSTGILGGQGKLPTVVSPELYRTRFCEAMDRYFLLVPDRWSGLGQGVDC